VTLQIGAASPCTIDIGPDTNNDAPPGYTDAAPPMGAIPSRADFTTVGPNADFDIKAQTAETCIVNLTEDTGLKRTFAFRINVQSGW
jgi:hypothetical protein